MMRWLYLAKILLHLHKLAQAVRSPFRSLWQIVLGKDEHYLRLRDGQVLLRSITPPNLFGFTLLRSAGVQLASEQPSAPDQLLWQLTPTGQFLTRLTTGMDLMTLYELFVRKDYGEDFADKVVVDVGAYNGDSAIFFALRGAQKVIALEPYPPNYELAQANVARMHLEEKIILLPVALGAEVGHLSFKVAAASPDANSLEPTNSPLLKLIRYTEAVEVEVLSLPALMAQYSLETIDFLKLDCEGCEFGVIESLTPAQLRSVRVWHIEYHAKPDRLIHKLQAAGFRVRRERDRGGVLGYVIADFG
ncbi:MAG: FkbM family methyltransferase [Bacteroidia bacterium]|nr:FkbM family methyltransferase [Bacteroidia bacterium]